MSFYQHRSKSGPGILSGRFTSHKEISFIDFETRSRVNIKDTGAWRYSESEDTEVLCLAFSLNGGMCVWTPSNIPHPDAFESDKYASIIDDNCPSVLRKHIESGGFIAAWNAEFEVAIWKNVMVPRYGWPELQCEQIIDVMAQAGAHAIPLSLKGAGDAMNVEMPKSEEGHKLMLKMCKPRKPTKNNPSEWFMDTEMLHDLVDYCVRDVEAEEELYRKLPKLIQKEKELFVHHLGINERGIPIDTEFINKVLGMIARVEDQIDERVQKISNGELSVADLRRISKLKKYLESKGLIVYSLSADTIDALVGSAPNHLKGVLECRQQISKTSTKKYQAMLNRANSDGRVRGTMVYHGSTTGRTAGRGIQPLNLPKPTFDDEVLDQLRTSVLKGDLNRVNEISNYKPMDAFAGLVRSAIKAPDGKTFICSDFSSIEARVLLWLAEDEQGLKTFVEGGDIYKEMASAIYRVPVDEISKDQRAVGKLAILGLGFGLGHVKFEKVCETFGVELDVTAEQVVQTYREKYEAIRSYWYQTENAAIKAVKNPGCEIKCRKTAYKTIGDALYCRLPSGRLLSYVQPSIDQVMTPWGVMKDRLNFMGVGLNHQYGKQSTYSGRLVENNCQAVARDFLTEAIVRVEKAGYPVIMTVHDEIVCEVDDSITETDLDAFNGLMCELPDWAEGCPIEAEGWIGKYYRK